MRYIIIKKAYRIHTFTTMLKELIRPYAVKTPVQLKKEGEVVLIVTRRFERCATLL